MSSKKSRPAKGKSASGKTGPLGDLARAQAEVKRAQESYDKALIKRGHAIKKASRVHPVQEIADTLEISRSKVYEILGRFSAPRQKNSPKEPKLPF